ncbi:protein Turandot B2-like isoform X2 [Drosophila eugracilis]|uniref:protein Turandot B2-like isoform X2 n=1 Tax=Drosophila eugracilis TaxID=29029 RepID=UPI001BDAA59D|nr:protein Turandot B2-like isoform X2 [Drosophila eugracilis]
MNFTPAVICLALLLISPLCLGYTNEQREADSRRIIEIVENAKDDNAKINSIQELIDIYNRLSPSLSPEERQRISQLIDQNTDEIKVDGISAQGGRKSKFAGKVLSSAAESVAKGFFDSLIENLIGLFSSKKGED